MKIDSELCKIAKTYFKYFIPTTIGMLMFSLYCFADVFFISIGVGSNGLAALNICLPVFTAFSAIGMMFGVGTSICVSILRGQGEPEQANKTFTLSFMTILVLSITLTVFYYVFLKEIAVFLGANDVLMKYVIDYLKAIGGCIVFYMSAGMLTVVIRSDGNPNLAMAAGLAGNITNIVLDYIFIIPLQMGVFGAGLATVIGPIVNFCILMLYFILKCNKVSFTRHFLEFKLLLRVIKNGISISLLEIATGAVTFLTNLSLMKIGNEYYVAIFGIIVNISFIGKNVFSGTAQAAQPIISLNYASGKFDVVKKANMVATATAFAIGFISTCFMTFFSEQIVGFFVSHNPQIIKEGVLAIKIYYFAFCIVGVNTIMMYYFQSIEKSLYSTCLSLLRGIVFIFIGLVFLPKLFQITGIWLTLPLAEILTFLIFYPLKRTFESKHLCKA